MFHITAILKLINRGILKSCYSHSNKTYRKAKKFIFNIDCSGLIEFWLKRNYAPALDEIYDFVFNVKNVQKSQFERLYSFDYLDFFGHLENNSSPNWQLVDLDNLQYDTIVALAKNSGQNRYGHIAIILDVVKRTDKKLVLHVCDSSNVPHDEDNRDKKMGIGTGRITILNPSAPVSYVKYSRTDKKRTYTVRFAKLTNFESNIA